MQHSYKILYFDLLPPPPFFREANKVFTYSSILFLILSVAWSLDVFKTDPERGIIGDTLIIGSGLAALWYLSLLVTSAWRLKHYQAGARNFPSGLILLFPWTALGLLNATVLLAASLDLIVPEFGSRKWLWTALLALTSPIVAFEIPVLKNWLPKFELRYFPGIFAKSLPILLGRESGTSIEAHAKQVVEFQVEFMNFMDSDKTGSLADPMPPYYDSAQQKPFQSSLSCIHSTSALLGKRLNDIFKQNRWSMLDIGCGEGQFTCGVLAEIDNLPSAITAIDPAQANISSYRRLLRHKFPAISDVDTTLGKVEDLIDNLPSANLILVSHSLYATLDHNRKRAAAITSGLIEKTEDGLAVMIMASKDSYLYTIKRNMLGELRRPDRSSFGEDLLTLIPAKYKPAKEFIDSFVDITSLLADRDSLLAWMSYFCRLEIGELDSKYDFCQGLLRNAAIEVRSLPESDKVRIKNGVNRTLKISDDSFVIFHREMLITIPVNQTIVKSNLKRKSA
jgi:SAM-dependent methyltransferase